jgi:hypothetical protein
MRQRAEELEKKAERCLARVYKKLDAAEKQLPLARSEVLVSVLRGALDHPL